MALVTDDQATQKEEQPKNPILPEAKEHAVAPDVSASSLNSAEALDGLSGMTLATDDLAAQQEVKSKNLARSSDAKEQSVAFDAGVASLDAAEDTQHTTRSNSTQLSEDDIMSSTARRSQTVEQLSSEFGFSVNVVETAVGAVGFDATTCYNYISDKRIRDDSVHSSSSQLSQHAQVNALNVQEHVSVNHPQEAPCSQVFGTAEEKSKGGLKEDVQENGLDEVIVQGEPNKTPPTQVRSVRKPPPNHFLVLSPTHVSPTRKKLRTSLNNFLVQPSLTGGTDNLSAVSEILPIAPLATTAMRSTEANMSDEADEDKKMRANTSACNEADEDKKPIEKSPSDDQAETETGELWDDSGEDSNEEDTERGPARGVPLNFDDEEDEDETGCEYDDGEDSDPDSNLIQMLAQAAAAQGLSLNWLIQQAQDEEDPTPIEYPFESLPTNLAGVAEFIQSDKCRRIIILAGAGMSVASGIPDFRSSDGLYNTLNATSLTCSPPQQDAIRKDPSFALDQLLFMDNPLPLLETKRDFILGTYEQRWKATLAHRFVELLHAKTKKLARLYTQNIDGLEDQCSQLPEDMVIPVHGTMDRAECARCKFRASFSGFCEKVRDQIKDINNKDPTAPLFSTPITCTSCGYPTVKPAIVLFRSSLPADFFQNVGPDCRGVDLLIVMGTSLKVAPANSLVWRVPRTAMRLLVNREIVGEHLGMGFYENNDQGGRDFFAAGDCDNVLLELMEHLGWLPDLEPLLAEEKLPQSSSNLLHERLAKLHSTTNKMSSSCSEEAVAIQPMEG